MRKLLLGIALLAFLTIDGKEPAKEYKCDKVHTIRVGCICNDGTRSTATGKGACSKHKGVKHWLCK